MTIGTKKLIVSITLNHQEFEVGELISEGKQIFFKYYPDFIDLGIEISPLKLKLSDQILSADYTPFNGLFGVFDDSLPDGWGNLLLDRKLASKGISISEITPLDRLAYVGSKGMGALTYSPAIDSGQEESKLELDSIDAEMKQVFSGTDSEVIDELFNLGGSSGGARPKIFTAYNQATGNIIPNTDKLPEGYEPWIIKFASSSDHLDIANIEYAYYKMALDAGIEISESKIFTGASGKKYFGTKRFDRVDGARLHKHSAAGLMHDNFRLSTLDYGHLMDCAFSLENHVGAYEKILRLAAFNIFSYNKDDHSKNFSFLMDHKGQWKFAPAYDLTFSTSSHGFHSTMVSGESQFPGKTNLLELADHFRIKNAAEIIENVQEVVLNWKKYAQESGVGKESQELIYKVISQIRK